MFECGWFILSNTVQGTIYSPKLCISTYFEVYILFEVFINNMMDHMTLLSD